MKLIEHFEASHHGHEAGEHLDRGPGRLGDEPVHELRRSRCQVHTVGNRVAQELRQPLLADSAHPRALVLQPVLYSTGRGKGAEREHAFRVVDRNFLRDHRAGGRAADVKTRRPQMIRELDDVLHEPPRRELVGPGCFRRAMTAHVDTHDSKLAGEMRHPGVKALRAAHGGMHQDDGLGRAPGISEVVDRVGDPQAV